MNVWFGPLVILNDLSGVLLRCLVNVLGVSLGLVYYKTQMNLSSVLFSLSSRLLIRVRNLRNEIKILLWFVL